MMTTNIIDTFNKEPYIMSEELTGGIKTTNNNDIISPDRYVFWLDDLSILFKGGNYFRFIPMSDMSRVEQLNALSRFCIYLFLIFLAFGRADEWLYIPIVGLIFIIILYNLFEMDDDGKREELLRMKRKVKSPVTTRPEINYRTYIVEDDGETRVVDIDQEEQKEFEESLRNPDKKKDGRGGNNDSASCCTARSDADIGDDTLDLESLDTEDRQSLNLNVQGNTSFELEAGYIDSDGNFQYGSNYGPLTSKTKDEDNIRFSLEEFRIYAKNKCRKPTKDNPFMNPSVSDFNTPNVPVACNADDEDIQDELPLKFNEDMYRDLDDIFNRKNSQRQFFSVHHNVPNDQEAFARWCYKMPATCKTDQTRCLRYQDLRTKY
jgi:uncharacterized protein DUF5762